MDLYKQRLNLPNATFSRIDHHDAMVAAVYNVTLTDGAQLVLKICERPNDYLREVYFLTFFTGKLPVPRIIQVVEPEINVHGAILMVYLPGRLITEADFSEKLSFKMGSLLACIHGNRVSCYGDLTQSKDLNPDPRVPFALKFEEGLEECRNHLPELLLERCRRYYDSHLDLLCSVDGPCIIHRDFRAGNVIVLNEKITGIIDWSSARAGFAEEDFCPLEHGEWPSNPMRKKSFLAGYASIRPVPYYSEIMPLLRLNRALATIGFTVKRQTWKNSHSDLYKKNRNFLESLLNS